MLEAHWAIRFAGGVERLGRNVSLAATVRGTTDSKSCPIISLRAQTLSAPFAAAFANIC
jgi:hypothetical protein